jgi:hypothetical protein
MLVSGSKSCSSPFPKSVTPGRWAIASDDDWTPSAASARDFLQLLDFIADGDFDSTSAFSQLDVEVIPLEISNHIISAVVRQFHSALDLPTRSLVTCTLHSLSGIQSYIDVLFDEQLFQSGFLNCSRIQSISLYCSQYLRTALNSIG